MDGLHLSSRRHFLYYLGQNHCLQAEVRLTEQLSPFYDNQQSASSHAAYVRDYNRTLICNSTSVCDEASICCIPVEI